MTNKQRSQRDVKVDVRNQICILLHKGTEAINDNGDREPLATAIKQINRFDGYSVDLNPSYVLDVFGVKYTKDDYMITINEDNKEDGDTEILAIIKLKEGQCAGEWRVCEIDPYDFVYDEQIEAEARWEREAESAYERHYDSKTIYDDPRGY